MSKHFGKTWWGQQWLNALANIDHGNRLPRGSAYARNGSVKSVSVEGNTIKAKVQGSRPRPYDITIVIPAFSAHDVKKLTQAIAEKPVIVSKLLNRELDPELLHIAERNRLDVFPKQWNDLNMQCSCPDWAVPCKHLAAIIYTISTQIDNNPFLVFQLHKVDLPAALQKENIHIPQSGDGNVPLLMDALKAADGKSKTVKVKKHNTERADDAIYQSLNFSTLVPLTDPLIELLADAPVFYPNSGNFRDKYALALRKAVRNAQRIVAGKIPFGEFFSEVAFYKKLPYKVKQSEAFSLNHHAVIFLSLTANNDVSIFVDDRKTSASSQQLIAALWQIPPAHLQDYQPSVAVLRTALLLCFNLVANGAVVPQMVRLHNSSFAVRWLPAMISKEVKALTDQLEQLLPGGILRLNDKEHITHDTTTSLLAAFLNALVHELAEHQDGDVFLDLFFTTYSYAFNLPGEEALTGGISTWLQRYYLAQGTYRPAIVVEEIRNEKFQVIINVEEKDKPPEKPVLLRDVLTLKKYDKLRFEILQSLAQVSHFIPGLDDYVNSRGESLIILNAAAFVPFLMQAIPAIQLLSINILLPKSLQQILKPRASVHIKQKSKDNTGFLRLDKLLDFDWQVAIGDTVMGEDEFKRLLKKSEGLIKYKTNYIYVSPADLEKLHKHFSSSKEMSAFEMLRAALSNEYYGAKISLSDEVKELMRRLTEQKEIPLPNQLIAQLRPYQQRGFSWMYRNTQIGFGSVLADDMGLGKTLQVITTLLKYKEEGILEKEKALVVSPTGLLTNWQAEFDKFAPSLKYKLYHGTERKVGKSEKYDVLLTSYGVVRNEAAELKKKKWHVLVIDEAQNIKNHETAQSKAIKSIPAHTFIAMSGTPVENRLSELWSILDFCNRGFLGSLAEFRELFANPIQNQNNSEVAGKLKVITGPFIMRRLKTDKSIINDLPDKIEMDCLCHLAAAQASLYEKTLHKALQTIEAIASTDQKSLFVRQGLVLQMILALKQICNHPTQFLKNNILDASLSGKMELLFDKLESILEADEKVLIFSQFTEMGNLLKHFITERFGEAPLFYHGGCSIKQRKELVENFQSNRADKIFILSLKAAGTGLNLTAANHVIHYDLWWNPAVEAQATDRAYRIGQKSNVMVHRFITRGTFEERINEMIQHKKALASLTVATGEKWIGNLSNKELREMFEL